VNGFLIDAVVHWFAALARERSCAGGWIDVSLTDVNLAEIIVRTVRLTQILCRSVVDGADSQA